MYTETKDFHNFLAAPFGSSLTSKQAKSFISMKNSSYNTPDFQNRYGYPRTPKGKANMGVASSYLSDAFNAMAITLEQPFKDNAIYLCPIKVGLPSAPCIRKANLRACLDIIEHL